MWRTNTPSTLEPTDSSTLQNIAMSGSLAHPEIKKHINSQKPSCTDTTECNVHIRIFTQSRMIKGSHIHFHHGGNSDVGRTARDSPLGVQSDYESNMCCCTIHICACSGWGLRTHTCHRSSNNCAVEACDSRQRVSAIIRLSMAPNQPVLDLCQLKQSAVRQHVLHTEQSITD